jgi:hypothetical protein
MPPSRESGFFYFAFNPPAHPRARDQNLHRVLPLRRCQIGEPQRQTTSSSRFRVLEGLIRRMFMVSIFQEISRH